MDKIFGIPVWAIEVLVGCAVTAGLCVLVVNFGNSRYEDGRIAERGVHLARAVQDREQEILQQQADAAETLRIHADQQRVIYDQAKQLASLEADRDDLRSAGQRLRQQLKAFVASSGGAVASGDSAAGPVSTPVNAQAAVLAELFSEADQFAGELAEAIEQSRSAGFACERTYDALTASASDSSPGQE